MTILKFHQINVFLVHFYTNNENMISLPEKKKKNKRDFIRKSQNHKKLSLRKAILGSGITKMKLKNS